MKKLFMLIIAIAFAGMAAAQNKTAITEEKGNKAVKEEKAIDAGVKEEKASPAEKEKHNKFECPMCHMTAEKPGMCSMCKVEMKEAKEEKKAEKKAEKQQKEKGHGHDHQGHSHD